MNIKTADVLIIGSGGMALEYLKVLNSLNKSVDIIGRGDKKLNDLKKIYPQYNYYSGGLGKYLDKNPKLPKFVINTVNIEYLGSTSIMLLDYGVENLLIEKPGDLSKEGLLNIHNSAIKKDSRVFIAYNRRFYTSILDLISETKKDGGITSINFEFTEWAHTFGPDTHSLKALNKWVLSNSSHVIDTVFYLIGEPKKLSSYVNGVNNIEWHPSGSIFTGSGISILNIPFTYHSNWNGPGRWAIEVITNKRRFYLKPMEKLHVQEIGSVALHDFKIDDALDISFKPGLYLQTKAFLDLKKQRLQTIENQINVMKFYEEMAGY